MPHITVMIGADGPVIDLGVAVGRSWQRRLAAQGIVVPSATTVRALIDTGSDLSVVHPQVLHQLGVQATGSIRTAFGADDSVFGGVGVESFMRLAPEYKMSWACSLWLRRCSDDRWSPNPRVSLARTSPRTRYCFPDPWGAVEQNVSLATSSGARFLLRLVCATVLRRATVCAIVTGSGTRKPPPRKQCTPGASWGSGGAVAAWSNSGPDFRSRGS